MPKDCYPEPLTKVHFYAATGFVRDYSFSKKPVSGATSRHGAQPAILMDNGYILIDQAWGRKPKSKIEPLDRFRA